MTPDQHQRCERCDHTPADDRRALLTYGRGPQRRSVCEPCLSWAEKDLLRSIGPRGLDAAEREGRFTRPAPASATALAA
jgi:hypothetical protein